MPNRITFIILSTAILAPAANLTTTCIDSVGVVTLTWSSAVGQPQINVGKPTGTPLTGILPASGTAITGAWVTPGLSFFLVDQSGIVEASVTANTLCSSLPPAVDQGLGSGSYFPLAVGNTWVYKYNNRLVTASYVVETISGEAYQNGQTYYVLTETSPPDPTPVAMLRADSTGVIYQLTSSGEQVYLDPRSASPAPYSGALGVFNDTITPPTQIQDSLIQTNSVYARGIGLVNSQSTMLTGSSGGFTQSLELVDVKVNGFHLSVPQPKIALSIDNPSPDLTNQKAPNCALPCYFAACGIGNPVDPPGTYRPCGQIRIDTSAEAASYSVLVQLLDSTGTPVFQNTSQSQSTTTLNYVRLPLYTGTTPFKLLPPGNYTLVGTVTQGSTTLATSTIPVQIQ
jgi:hypothetical protein